MTPDEHDTPDDASPPLAKVRMTIETQTRENGTWSTPLDPRRPWVDAAVERHT